MAEFALINPPSHNDLRLIPDFSGQGKSLNQWAFGTNPKAPFKGKQNGD